MITILRAMVLCSISGSLLAQGRPAILRVSAGGAFPSGRTADLWSHGFDGALGFSLPSRGRTTLRLEAAYARFPVDVDKLKARYGISAADPVNVSGGALDGVSAMALLETYLTDPGNCSATGPIPPRLYFLLGAGYAGLFSRAYTITTPSTSLSSPSRYTGALALGLGLGGEWPRSPTWGVFAEARATGWWQLNKQFDIDDRWLSGRLGISIVL